MAGLFRHADEGSIPAKDMVESGSSFETNGFAGNAS